MSSSRAQSAIEFLISNGWAILIVIILLATLFYIGVLNPKNTQPNICAFSPGFSCYNFRVGNGTGSLELDMGQAIGKSIQVTGISCSTNESAPMQQLSEITVPSGEHRWITGGDSGNLGITCEGASGDAGDRYKGKVCVNYTESGTGTQRVVCGEINARLEPAPTPTPTPVPGWLYGRIDNCSDGLEGANVTAGTRSNTTNSSGQYIIYNVPPGNYTITASKASHATRTATKSVATGNGTRADFTLLRQITISSCQTLDHCAYYLLDRDLNPGSTCMTIASGASGSTLDCARHSITGQQSGYGIYLSYARNTTVQSCMVNNFSIGVYQNYDVYGTSRNNYINNTLTSNSYGFYCGEGNYNTFIGNNASSNSVWGFNLNQFCDGNTFTDNILNSNGYQGIYLYYSTGNNFTGNNATNNANKDFTCGGSDSNIDGGNNTCAKNDCTWLNCSAPPGACPLSITSCCTISQPGTYRLANDLNSSSTCITINPTGAISPTLDCAGHSITGQQSGYGIYVYYVYGAIVQNCIVKNFSIGIRQTYDVYGTSRDSYINNTLTSNSYGFYCGEGNYNTFIGNNVSSNSVWGFYLNQFCDGNTFTDNILNSNGYQGIYLYYSTGNNFTGNNATNNANKDFTCGGSDSNTDGGNNTCGRNDCIWLNCSAPPDACPLSITSCCPIYQPGTYTLSNNLTSSGTCITINPTGATSPTLDCAGHSITGQQSGSGVYMYYVNGAAVQNCIIKNFTYGIYQTYDVYGTSRDSYINNTLATNYIGFGCGEGNYNTFIGNNVSSNSVWGFYLNQFCDGNTFTNNTISSNGYQGTYLYYSTGNNYTGNNATGNPDADFSCGGSDSNTDGGSNICSKSNGCNKTLGYWLDCTAPSPTPTPTPGPTPAPGDYALSFDGTDDHVNVPDSPSLDITGEITIEAWAKTNVVDSTYDVIVSKYPSDTYQLGFNAGGQQMYFCLWPGSLEVVSDSAPTASQWYHVVGIRDGSGTMKIFVNGVQQSNTRSFSGSINTNDASLWIGGVGSGSYYFNGVIDDVRIYSRALSPTEVSQHYGGTYSDESGLVGKWLFDEGSGTTAGDTSGNGNSGTISGATWVAGRP